MGMFDEVICHYPLPNLPNDKKKRIFQTKSLESTMDLYTITEKGKLIHDVWHYEDTPEEKRKYSKEDGLFGLIGMYEKIIDEKDVLVPYTGLLYFYDYQPARPAKNIQEFCLDYYAWFEQGHIQMVLNLPDSTEEDAEVFIQQAIEKEKLEKSTPVTNLLPKKTHI